MEQTPVSADDRAGAWRDYDAPGLDALHDAALDIFTEFGWHGTTVRAVAKQAGLSVPGLYYHFASKQEILAELLRISNEDIMARAKAAARDGGDCPRQRFVFLVENIVLYMTHRRRLAHLAREMKFLAEPYRGRHIARRDELESMLRDEVVAAKRRSLFDVADPSEATRAVWVMCRGVADWYVAKGPKSPDELAASYVQFALKLVGDRATTRGPAA